LAPRILSTLVDTLCLRESGVREFCATDVRNTVDEALTMRRILARERVDRVMVVTSRSHVVRTAAIFTVVYFGTGVDVNVVATPLGASRECHPFERSCHFSPAWGPLCSVDLTPNCTDGSCNTAPGCPSSALRFERGASEQIPVRSRLP
jgi:hypothetical protein